jgi:hypothetical protein
MILFILVGVIALVFGIRAIPRTKDNRRADWFERQMEDFKDE